MPTKPRSEIFCSSEQAIVHTMNRSARPCFMPTYDSETGEYLGNRREMFEQELYKSASGFAIDLLSYSLLDDQFHLILRNRPDVVEEWTDVQVIKQWHILCPIIQDSNGVYLSDPTDEDAAELAADAERVATYRKRLSDISWFMKLISERIARWCNAADDANGHFWVARYKGVRLLDSRAILTCSMYVDLNRIQAELAESIQSSDYAAIQRRIQNSAMQTTMRKIMAEECQRGTVMPSIAISMGIDSLEDSQSSDETDTNSINSSREPDEAPIDTPSERRSEACSSSVPLEDTTDLCDRSKVSAQPPSVNEWYPWITQEEYIELMHWSVDQIRTAEGKALGESPPALEELGIAPEVWCSLVTQFTDLFYVVAGMPESVDNFRSLLTGKRFYMPGKTRDMLAA